MISMQGTILSYRRGRHTQNVNQMLIELENVDSKEKAKKLFKKAATFNALNNLNQAYIRLKANKMLTSV